MFAIAVPVVGSLIVGLMARYGSDDSRPWHPRSNRIDFDEWQPSSSRDLAILKPVPRQSPSVPAAHSARKGPIIMTGGAIGSMIAQFFHLTSAERKTLLVAGAAAGHVGNIRCAAIAPSYSRSNCCCSNGSLAASSRSHWPAPRPALPAATFSDLGRCFRFQPIPYYRPGRACWLRLVGLLAGALSALLTIGVYAVEDAFQKLPIHWMWWPAIGGVFVGIGGLIFPQALGVGYDTIGTPVQGDVAFQIHSGRAVREVGHLDDFAGLRHLRRRPCPSADDGRRSRRRLRHVSARISAWASGPWSAWARFSAARCARRSPASYSRWS